MSAPPDLAGYKGGSLRQGGEGEKTGSGKGRKKERREERERRKGTCSIASRG